MVLTGIFTRGLTTATYRLLHCRSVFSLRLSWNFSYEIVPWSCFQELRQTNWKREKIDQVSSAWWLSSGYGEVAHIISAYAIVFIGVKQKKGQPEDGLATQDIILSTCRRGSKLHSEGLLSKLEVSSRYRWTQGRMHPRARGLMYWIERILVRGEFPLCCCFLVNSCAFDRNFDLLAYIGVHFNRKDLLSRAVSTLVILTIYPFLLKKLVAHWP